VIVTGGLEWATDLCRRANPKDLRDARSRASSAAARVRTAPDPTDPEWCAALKTLTEALDYLRDADPGCAHLKEGQAWEAARRVHPDAHLFVPFTRHGEDDITGWTFRTGYAAGDRYGVVTAAAEIAGCGLHEYRTTAERAYLYGQEPEAGRS
jgi:hypothetical protein